MFWKKSCNLHLAGDQLMLPFLSVKMQHVTLLASWASFVLKTLLSEKNAATFCRPDLLKNQFAGLSLQFAEVVHVFR